MENKELKDKGQAGCGCGCGESKEQKPQASCCAGTGEDEKKINLNAACCGPSSPGVAKVRFFIFSFFIVAALIVLIYGSMHK
jgi:hypothetical protein